MCPQQPRPLLGLSPRRSICRCGSGASPRPRSGQLSSPRPGLPAGPLVTVLRVGAHLPRRPPFPSPSESSQVQERPAPSLRHLTVPAQLRQKGRPRTDHGCTQSGCLEGEEPLFRTTFSYKQSRFTDGETGPGRPRSPVSSRVCAALLPLRRPFLQGCRAQSWGKLGRGRTCDARARLEPPNQGQQARDQRDRQQEAGKQPGPPGSRRWSGESRSPERGKKEPGREGRAGAQRAGERAPAAPTSEETASPAAERSLLVASRWRRLTEKRWRLAGICG